LLKTKKVSKTLASVLLKIETFTIKKGDLRMAKRKWTKEEIKEYRKIKGAFFYANTEDSNVFVSKVYGFGWNINWANPISWVLVLVILGFIASRILYK